MPRKIISDDILNNIALVQQQTSSLFSERSLRTIPEQHSIFTRGWMGWVRERAGTYQGSFQKYRQCKHLLWQRSVEPYESGGPCGVRLPEKTA